jgi:hypothetical protein
VPHVDGRAGQRAAAAGDVEQRQLERRGDAVGHAGGVAEALGDVAADDAALAEHVGAVGPVARERAAGLLRHGAGLARGGWRGAVLRGPAPDEQGTEAAGDGGERAPARDQRQVVG